MPISMLKYIKILKNIQICFDLNRSSSGSMSVCQKGKYMDCWEALYRVSQEEYARLRESVPYVKLYRHNPKHLYPKLNGYGDNGQRKVWAIGVSTYCTPSVTPYSSTAHARQRDTDS